MTYEQIDQIIAQRINAALGEYAEKITELLESIDEQQRRLDNAIRFGVVASVSDDAKKIKVEHGERTTPWIRWFTPAGGEMMHYRCPSVGESALLIDVSSGMGAQGYVALCGFESDAFPFSDASPKKVVTKAGSLSVEWDLDGETLTLMSPTIKLNDNNQAGAVTGFNRCSFTGLPHPDCSKSVLIGQ
ncbi:phage baseplate assembly protein V [Vibrio parahaemolyticus]|nr:phage baseplate assembly protein V [Vibrio parahaemolyticus]EJE8673481.1 phage baseplate assembly protein V [Vibrio parahaemolyticus]